MLKYGLHCLVRRNDSSKQRMHWSRRSQRFDLSLYVFHVVSDMTLSWWRCIVSQRSAGSVGYLVRARVCEGVCVHTQNMVAFSIVGMMRKPAQMRLSIVSVWVCKCLSDWVIVWLCDCVIVSFIDWLVGLPGFARDSCSIILIITISAFYF